MSNDQPKWGDPGNKSEAPDAAGDLARKHGISPDRAQMLIDRLGHDPDLLDAEAQKISQQLGQAKRSTAT